MFTLSLDKEGLVGKYSLLSDGLYFLLSYFLLLYRGGEVKIELNGKNVRLVLSTFGYLLAMSRSDFAKYHTLHDMSMVFVIDIEDNSWCKKID